MPLYSSEALILRTYKLREADRIVVFLTRDRGKKRGVAEGARRTRSRFAGALEPLTQVKVAYFERERRDLVGLNYAEVLRSPFSALDCDALGYVGYFAELIDEWAPEGDPNERMYRLGASVVEALASGVPVEPLARYFEYWLLRLQGVYPALARCRDCATWLGEGSEGGYLVASAQAFLCDRCATAQDVGHGTRLTAAAIGFLRAAVALPPCRLGELTAPAGAMKELEVAHRVLIVTHLEKELKSARVLRAMRN
jgi:DNA repair protein RecO (recombination protein O)